MEHESQKTGQPRSTGIDLNLGILNLKIDLSITGFRTLTDTLQQTLAETEGALNENVTRLVDTVEELGVENIRNWAMAGGHEAKELFNKLYSQMEEVYRRGMTKAGDLVESFGGKMQDVAYEDPGTTH